MCELSLKDSIRFDQASLPRKLGVRLKGLKIFSGDKIPKTRPLSDKWILLCLLVLPMGRSRLRLGLAYSRRSPIRHAIWRREVYNMGCDRSEFAGEDRILITDDVIDELLKIDCLEPGDGLSYFDSRFLILSQKGYEMIAQRIETVAEERQKKAKRRCRQEPAKKRSLSRKKK